MRQCALTNCVLSCLLLALLFYPSSTLGSTNLNSKCAYAQTFNRAAEQAHELSSTFRIALEITGRYLSLLRQSRSIIDKPQDITDQLQAVERLESFFKDVERGIESYDDVQQPFQPHLAITHPQHFVEVEVPKLLEKKAADLEGRRHANLVTSAQKAIDEAVKVSTEVAAALGPNKKIADFGTAAVTYLRQIPDDAFNLANLLKKAGDASRLLMHNQGEPETQSYFHRVLELLSLIQKSFPSGKDFGPLPLLTKSSDQQHEWIRKNMAVREEIILEALLSNLAAEASDCNQDAFDVRDWEALMVLVRAAVPGLESDLPLALQYPWWSARNARFYAQNEKRFPRSKSDLLLTKQRTKTLKAFNAKLGNKRCPAKRLSQFVKDIIQASEQSLKETPTVPMKWWPYAAAGALATIISGDKHLFKQAQIILANLKAKLPAVVHTHTLNRTTRKFVTKSERVTGAQFEKVIGKVVSKTKGRSPVPRQELTALGQYYRAVDKARITRGILTLVDMVENIRQGGAAAVYKYSDNSQAWLDVKDAIMGMANEIGKENLFALIAVMNYVDLIEARRSTNDDTQSAAWVVEKHSTVFRRKAQIYRRLDQVITPLFVLGGDVLHTIIPYGGREESKKLMGMVKTRLQEKKAAVNRLTYEVEGYMRYVRNTYSEPKTEYEKESLSTEEKEEEEWMQRGLDRAREGQEWASRVSLEMCRVANMVGAQAHCKAVNDWFCASFGRARH